MRDPVKHIADDRLRRRRDAQSVSLACRGRDRPRPLRQCALSPSNHVTVALWDWPSPANTVLISDGGLATELEARGHDLSDPLWSARLLVGLPRTRSSRCTPRTSARAPRSRRPRATRRRSTGSRRAAFGPTAKPIACCAAASNSPGRRATTSACATRWVAASVGPYGAALADGVGIPRALRPVRRVSWPRWHRPRLEVLAVRAARTCWPWKPCPTSTRPRRWSTWCARSACRPGSATPSTATRTRAGQPLDRGVRGGRRGRRDRRGRGQLLRPRRRAGAVDVASPGSPASR